MRSLILAVLILFAVTLSAQNFNKKVQDDKLDTEVLVDYVDSTALYDGMFGLYYKTQYETYSPKTKFVKKAKTIFNGGDYEIVTVLGDWCSDSKLQVGRFDKVLAESSFPKSKYKHIAVDREKKAREVDITKYRISRVPTFIIFLNGIEIGRITESPDTTLEKDL
ncbi:MAG: hypothetical protein C0595_08625 [Marinilabiliales bacterium]|nr:MAG: hypothetical protein C0595_08625 [Marinilabiliales bacterium]